MEQKGDSTPSMDPGETRVQVIGGTLESLTQEAGW